MVTKRASISSDNISYYILFLSRSMTVVDEESSIPITVFHGRHPGKRVIMQAATHGFEFVSILGLRQLAKEIDVSNLCGELRHSARNLMLFVRSA